MKNSSNIFLALLHYPIYDRSNKIVSTSVTNLDIHDFSRLARTYSLGGYFIVSPVDDQKEMVDRIVNHWKVGYGKEYNSHRAEALKKTFVVDTLTEVREAVKNEKGMFPLLLTTSAKFGKVETISPSKVNELAENKPVVVLFGTGYGLAESVITACDFKIEGINTDSDYNHLSVRSAASILVDRIFS